MAANHPIADIRAVIQKRQMKIKVLLTSLVAFLVSAAPSPAQTKAQSSPEDRQRFVGIVRNLERAPLDPGLHADRTWAIRWLTDAPDVSVTVCSDPLGDVVSEKGYPHSSEMVVQYMLAMGAFSIENPGKHDLEAEQLAGVESALTAYKAMRTAQPKDRSSALEKLLAVQSQGELPSFVRKAFRRCLASGAN